MRIARLKYLMTCMVPLCFFSADAQQKVFETNFRVNEKGSVINECEPQSFGKLEKHAKIVDTPVGKAVSLPGDIASGVHFPAGETMSALKRDVTVGMWVAFDTLPDENAPRNKQCYGFFSRGWRWRASISSRKQGNAQFTTKADNGEERHFITKPDLREMAPGTWNHIAVTYSTSSGQTAFYLNGELKASRDTDVHRKGKLLPLDTAQEPLILGSLPNYYPWNGRIGRTRIYSQALTPDQMNAEERDIAVSLLKKCMRDAPVLKDEIDRLLAKKTIPLAEVGRIQKKVLSHAEDKQFTGGGAAPLYYSVVNPMGEENFLPDSILPKSSVNGPLLIAAAKNEFEPASFLVRPLQDIPEFLPVLSEFRTKDGKTLPADIADIRIVKVLVQSGGGAVNRQIRTVKPVLLLHDDALVKVDFDKMENYLRLSFPEGEKYQWISEPGDSVRFEEYISAKDNPVRDAKTIRPLNLKKNFNQQYWLTFHPPADAAPGLYHAQLNLNSKGKTLVTIPVKLRVLPFELPDPKPNYDLNRKFFTSIYYRHYEHNLLDENAPGSITSRGRNEQQFRAELRNLRDHGIQYPTIVMDFKFPGWKWNTFGTSRNGGKIRTITPQDVAYFKKCMQILREEGMETRPLFLHTGGNFGFRHLYKSAENKELLKKFIEETHAVVKAVLGHAEVEFYGVDEAHGSVLTGQYEIWKDMRDLGAEVFTTATRTNVNKIAGRVSTMVSSGVPEKFYAEEMHRKGGTIWNYANPQAGRKDQPFPYRVNYGFGVYSANYDGIATYGYNISAANPWNDFDNRVEPDLAFVIPTADGVIDTPSWEGYREGIDDIRYATKLRYEIAKAMAGNDAKKKEIASAAEKWLGKMNVHAQGFDPEWTRFQIIEWILKLI